MIFLVKLVGWVLFYKSMITMGVVGAGLIFEAIQVLRPSFHSNLVSHEQVVEIFFETECSNKAQLMFEQSLVNGFQTKGE